MVIQNKSKNCFYVHCMCSHFRIKWWWNNNGRMSCEAWRKVNRDRIIEKRRLRPRLNLKYLRLVVRHCFAPSGSLWGILSHFEEKWVFIVIKSAIIILSFSLQTHRDIHSPKQVWCKSKVPLWFIFSLLYTKGYKSIFVILHFM